MAPTRMARASRERTRRSRKSRSQKRSKRRAQSGNRRVLYRGFVNEIEFTDVMTRLFDIFDDHTVPELFYGHFTGEVGKVDGQIINYILETVKMDNQLSQEATMFFQTYPNGKILYFRGSDIATNRPMDRTQNLILQVFWRDYMKCTQRCFCAAQFLKAILKNTRVKHAGKRIVDAACVVTRTKFFMHDHFLLKTSDSPPASWKSCMPLYDPKHKDVHNVLRLTYEDRSAAVVELTPGQIDPDPPDQGRWNIPSGEVPVTEMTDTAKIYSMKAHHGLLQRVLRASKEPPFFEK